MIPEVERIRACISLIDISLLCICDIENHEIANLLKSKIMEIMFLVDDWCVKNGDESLKDFDRKLRGENRGIN